MTYLDIPEDILAQKNATWTAREITQQPDTWLKTQKILQDNAVSIREFLSPLIAKDNLRVILTGAGTSAFVGECLAPILLNKMGKRVEAIATTDLVSGPREFFQRHVPTLLVSFGRSGSSPESVAAVDLSNQMVEECYQLVITCNPDGELYERCKTQDNSFALLLPEETHDKSFAMTSSFSNMMYAALMMLSDRANHCEAISAAAASVINDHNAHLKTIADKNYERVIFLGSNGFKGLAREASLKLLELTDGQAITLFDSPLGFRHGPKTIVTDNTLIVLFVSNDPYTRQYDLDLLEEIRTDGETGQVLAITARKDDTVTQGDYLTINGLSEAEDCDLLFPFIVCAQIYAFHHALKIGMTPDNPSVSGTVNRVVQGVTIHPL